MAAMATHSGSLSVPMVDFGSHEHLWLFTSVPKSPQDSPFVLSHIVRLHGLIELRDVLGEDHPVLSDSMYMYVSECLGALEPGFLLV
jgi:hypothetical protein